MQAFSEKGHACARSWTDLVQACNTVVLAVYDTDGVIDVAHRLRMARKALDMDDRGMKWIDCSTGDPTRIENLARELSSQGIGLIEAPLSGSSVQIEQGQATLWASGQARDLDEVEPILKALSPKVIRVGKSGMASRAKLATNLVLGLNRSALAEGMVLAQTLGIDADTFLQLVLASPARSAAAEVKGQMMVQRSFAPQSRIHQHLKDIHLMLDLAARQGQCLPLSQAHAQLLQSAIDAGDGELDNAGIVLQIERSKTRPQ